MRGMGRCQLYRRAKGESRRRHHFAKCDFATHDSRSRAAPLARARHQLLRPWAGCRPRSRRRRRRSGCRPSRWLSFGLAGDAFEEERIEQHVVFRGELRIDRLEGAARNRRPRLGAARMPASSTGIWRSLSRRTISSSALRVTCGIDATQHVVGAKLHDDRVGAVRHRPVEPRKPARGGVAGNAGIGDLDRDAPWPQRRFELGRKCGAAPAGRSPAVSESPSATIVTGRSAAWRRPA